MNRFLPFLLALLVADLAVAEETFGLQTTAITSSPLIIKGLWPGMSTTNGMRSVSSHDSPRSSETAVLKGLHLLVTNQNPNGSWGTAEAVQAETGLALLAFLGHGETPSSQEYGPVVKNGFKFLLDEILTTYQNKAIGAGIATWALSEGYGMTKISALREGVEKAVSLIISQQRQSGLWDLNYRMDGGLDDVEASYWQVLALQSRLSNASNPVPIKTSLERAVTAIEKKLQENPEPGDAILLLRCLQVTGRSRSSAYKEAYASITNITPDWAGPSFRDPLLRWNALQQLSFCQGHQDWIRMNRITYPMLIKNQVSISAQKNSPGFWDSPDTAERYGRTYSTALCIMMLEVYYRFLPIYHPPNFEEDSTNTNDIVIKFG